MQFDVVVPTIRDRVVQTAVKIVVEPIFEADLEPNAYGYRPERSATDAIREVHKLLCDGYIPVAAGDRAAAGGLCAIAQVWWMPTCPNT